MAKKLKETDIHTYGHTDGLPLVVLSAALQQKINLCLLNVMISKKNRQKCAFLDIFFFIKTGSSKMGPQSLNLVILEISENMQKGMNIKKTGISFSFFVVVD